MEYSTAVQHLAIENVDLECQNHQLKCQLHATMKSLAASQQSYDQLTQQFAALQRSRSNADNQLPSSFPSPLSKAKLSGKHTRWKP